jgi:prophage regulatory protein
VDSNAHPQNTACSQKSTVSAASDARESFHTAGTKLGRCIPTTQEDRHDQKTKSRAYSDDAISAWGGQRCRGLLRSRDGADGAIRRHELRLIVSLADSTIYEMEKRGEFPRRFNLTPCCVVWNLQEVEAWLEQRRQTYLAGCAKLAPSPDVRQRKTRRVRAQEVDIS